MKYLFVVLVVVCGVCGQDEAYYRRLDALVPEAPCNSAGGVCTFAVDCPELTGTSGQCPKQQSQGVECCNGISVRDTRCRSRGGECVSKNRSCGPQYSGATDCANDEKCCIWV